MLHFIFLLEMPNPLVIRLQVLFLELLNILVLLLYIQTMLVDSLFFHLELLPYSVYLLLKNDLRLQIWFTAFSKTVVAGLAIQTLSPLVFALDCYLAHHFLLVFRGN
jgi:hypothetical protein